MNRLLRIAHVPWPFLRAVLERYWQHEGGVIAGYMAFSAMLAIVPFLLFATAFTGYVIGTEGSDTTVEMIFQIMPPTVAETIEPVLMEIVGQRRSSSLITVAIVGALYAASNGAEAVRVALDRAYEADIPRNFLQHYLFSFVIVLLGFLIFIVLSVFIILAPILYRLLQQGTEAQLPFGAGAVRYALSAAVLAFFLWIVHRILPSRRMRGFRLWPGVLTTVTIWVMAGTGFSIYLANIGTYTVTYGTLAGVIVTLVFFYIAGTSIIFGGEVNAVVNADKLVTVLADEEVLAAVDEQLAEEDRAALPPEERAAMMEAREKARAGDAPATAESELDSARSPAERAEAHRDKVQEAAKAKKTDE